MNTAASTILACFFCGVDSKALLVFFILFVACAALGTISLLFYTITKGDFTNVEATKYDVFDDLPESEKPERPPQN